MRYFTKLVPTSYQRVRPLAVTLLTFFTSLILSGAAHGQMASTPATGAVPTTSVVPPPQSASAHAASSKAKNPVNKAASKPAVSSATSKLSDLLGGSNKPSWNELTAPQQQALAPLAQEWDKLEPIRKNKWLQIANKFPQMKPEEQHRIQERMREWAKLTPDQRRIARENYTRAKKITPDQKSEKWQEYQELSPEQKKKLAQEATSKKQVTNLPLIPAQNKLAPSLKSSTRTNSKAMLPNGKIPPMPRDASVSLLPAPAAKVLPTATVSPPPAALVPAPAPASPAPVTASSPAASVPAASTPPAPAEPQPSAPK